MNPTMMEQVACQAPQMMSGVGSNLGPMMSHPLASGAMLAAGGYAAGKGLLGGVLRNPLLIFATGVAAGYLLYRYQKEIIAAASKLTGIGKDFVLHQKENLEDLLAETKTAPGSAAAAPAAAAEESKE